MMPAPDGTYPGVNGDSLIPQGDQVRKIPQQLRKKIPQSSFSAREHEIFK